MPLHPLNESQIAFLEEYRSSGMTVLEFARYKRISKHTVYYYIDKERKLKAAALSNEVIKANNFIPVPFKNDCREDKDETPLIKLTPNKKNNLISFNLNGLSISIDKENLKAFLEVINNGWFK